MKVGLGCLVVLVVGIGFASIGQADSIPIGVQGKKTPENGAQNVPTNTWVWLRLWIGGDGDFPFDTYTESLTLRAGQESVEIEVDYIVGTFGLQAWCAIKPLAPLASETAYTLEYATNAMNQPNATLEFTTGVGPTQLQPTQLLPFTTSLDVIYGKLYNTHNNTGPNGTSFTFEHTLFTDISGLAEDPELVFYTLDLSNASGTDTWIGNLSAVGLNETKACATLSAFDRYGRQLMSEPRCVWTRCPWEDDFERLDDPNGFDGEERWADVPACIGPEDTEGGCSSVPYTPTTTPPLLALAFVVFGLLYRRFSRSV